MNCIVCNKNPANLSIPLDITPKTLVVHTTSLCQTPYVFKQYVADHEINSDMEIIDSQIVYDDTRRVCCTKCLVQFVTENENNVVYSRTLPIYYASISGHQVPRE